MKLHIWTESRDNGTTINPGKGDGLVCVRKGQTAIVVVVDGDDPAVSRILRLLDLVASGEVIA